MKRYFSLLTLVIFLLGSFLMVSAQIKGTLLKSNGKPLPYTEIELVPVGSKKIINDSRLIGISSAAGKFSFLKVPPGKYTLSINFDDKPTDLSPFATFFYPDTAAREEAEIFEFDGSAKIRTITFKVPPALARGKITGRVVSADGQPVEGAWMALRDLEFDRGAILFGTVKTGKDGSFTMPAFAARRYQVAAILLLNPQMTIYDPPEIIGAAESDIFTLGPTPSVLKLVLRQSDDYDQIRDKYVGVSRPEMQNFTRFKILNGS